LRVVWLEAEFSTPVCGLALRRGVAEEDAEFEMLLKAKAKLEDAEQAERTENVLTGLLGVEGW
jgi:hypothetical protein